MKLWTYLLLLTIVPCYGQDPKANNHGKSVVVKTTSKENDLNQICWIGTLNGKIPVFIHYELDGDLIIGEIIYLNTKNRQPIKLIGTIEDDKTFRLLEFERSGNITGVIEGLPLGKVFNGSWTSPKTKKELALSLTRKDTIVNPVVYKTHMQDVFGHYHYQYSEAGYQGDFEIQKLSEKEASFGITSVTSEPARNVAQVDNDTVKLKATGFTYKIPDTENCEFEVKFYKGFAYIRYTQGFCDGQFGLNATIDGIFLKTQ